MSDVDTKGIRVVVYGTLKKGQGNHRYYLSGERATYLGRTLVRGNYAMFCLGGFPAVVENPEYPEAEILGEVYVVPEETLDALDVLEGHPNWYERKQVDTSWKKAWLYIMPGSEVWDSDSLVESGCWRATDEEKEWIENERQNAAA